MKKIRGFLFRNYLDKGEKILDVAHRHIVLFKYAAAKSFLAGVLAPIFLYILFPFPAVAIIALVWGLVGVFGVIYHFIDWYYDAWLITNIGIIAIKRNGYFDVATQRVDYYLINDISYTIKGFIPTVLNFGDVTIDRMAASVAVVLKDAYKPKKLERKINAYRARYARERSIRDHNELKGMLAEMIAYHNSNK